MKRNLFSTALWAMAAFSSSFSYDMAAIVKKVSENNDKIVTYRADAEVRYHI